MSVHLTEKQRYFIEFDLNNKKSPKQIVDSWDSKKHEKEAPSVQTIRKIKKQFERGDSVKPKKKGPSKKSVLTPEKLDEIKKTIAETGPSSYQQLSMSV